MTFETWVFFVIFVTICVCAFSNHGGEFDYFWRILSFLAMRSWFCWYHPTFQLSLCYIFLYRLNEEMKGMDALATQLYPWSTFTLLYDLKNSHYIMLFTSLPAWYFFWDGMYRMLVFSLDKISEKLSEGMLTRWRPPWIETFVSLDAQKVNYWCMTPSLKLFFLYAWRCCSIWCRFPLIHLFPQLISAWTPDAS